MTHIRMLHKSGKISGRYDYRKGFIPMPYSQNHHTFVRMYEITNRWWHCFMRHRRIRVVMPIEEHNMERAWDRDREIIDFIAARTRYRADVKSWIYFNREDNEFHKWIEISFQSKRDAMLVKLAWA